MSDQQHFLVYTHPAGGSTTITPPLATIDVLKTDQGYSLVATHANGSSTLMIEGLSAAVADGVASFLRDWISSIDRGNTTTTPGINLNALLDSLMEKDSKIVKPAPRLVE